MQNASMFVSVLSPCLCLMLNPVNDAGAISLLFKTSGFDVVETRQNLAVNDLRRAIRDFSDKTRDADIAVVFYAGHGIEVNGNNYIIPIDGALERDIDVEDETVSLERILSVVEPAKRLRLVILDACRDNPFARNMKRTIARRAIGRGLASVEPTMSDTLIAFAAKAGSTAPVSRIEAVQRSTTTGAIADSPNFAKIKAWFETKMHVALR
jgi:uncharacterized caspase-like protein